MKQDTYNVMKRVSVYVDQMQLFVIIDNVGIMINVDANVKNWLIQVYAIKDMLRIQVIVNANVINHVMLASIQIKRIVNLEKSWQINCQMNAMKLLRK